MESLAMLGFLGVTYAGFPLLLWATQGCERRATSSRMRRMSRVFRYAFGIELLVAVALAVSRGGTVISDAPEDVRTALVAKLGIILLNSLALHIIVVNALLAAMLVAWQLYFVREVRGGPADDGRAYDG